MRDEANAAGIVIFGDQARHFVDFAGDHEVFQESFEREVGEGHLRGHAFLSGGAEMPARSSPERGGEARASRVFRSGNLADTIAPNTQCR